MTDYVVELGEPVPNVIRSIMRLNERIGGRFGPAEAEILASWEDGTLAAKPLWLWLSVALLLLRFDGLVQRAPWLPGRWPREPR
jgi:hypothetical protein